MIKLALPLPPSVNHYYGRRGSRTFMSKSGQAFIEAVWFEFCRVPRRKLQGAIRMHVVIHPASKRRMDLDNRLKALQDAMERAGVYDNDSQITDIHIQRGHEVDGGLCVVELTEIY
jgi:crossover junction endodeoxyribonuclease RusA